MMNGYFVVFVDTFRIHSSLQIIDLTSEAAQKIIYLPFINEFHFSNFLIKNQFGSVLVI